MAKETKAPAAMKTVETTFAEGWKPAQVGDSIGGVYMGWQDVPGGKRGAFRTFHLRATDGKRWSVSGANLATVFPQIPKGTTCLVTFTGTQETDKGLMKLFAVEIPEGTLLIDPMENDDH